MNYEELVKNHSGEIIERLVREIVGEEAVEVRFEFEDNKQWSIIGVHRYEEDQEISIRLYPGDEYELCFGYYDDDDEFFEIIQLLTEEEKMSLPKGLKKVMEKVLVDEQGMRLRGNFLSK